MKKLTKYALLLAALALGFAFTSCQQDSGDDTSQPPAYYTVSFNSNGGTEVKSQKVESGKKATKPADPTKTETKTEAFVFAGWYTSTDGGTTLSDTAFDFDTTVKADITLYAKWNVYTIEYIKLKNCSEIRTMFETLCEYYLDESLHNFKFKKTITRFAKAEAKPASAENYIDAAGKQIPLWYDEATTTLYYYLEPYKKMSLRTSDGQNSLFKDMSDAVSIETKDFDTSKVTTMCSMFSSCSSLTALDVSKFDTSKVNNMDSMFSFCKALTSLDVSKFDTSNVTVMSTMFSRCDALTSLDVSSFDTSNVTRMLFMFYRCSSLTTIFASDKFVTDAVTDSGDMFTDCTKLKGGAGTVYDSSKIDKTYARIDGGTENPGYFTAK